MDILTHATLGAVLATPLATQHPVLSAGFILGSVLPDLDALTRALGKRAFMISHQTFSHSFTCQALILLLGWLCTPFLGSPAFGLLGTGLAAGMLLHSLLDFTNTLGVTLLAPFSWRRFHLDWIFFIDVPMLLTSTIAFAGTHWLGWSTSTIAILFGIALPLYVALRGRLAQHSRSLVPPDTVSLLPSPWLPWCFHGFRRDGDAPEGLTFRLNAITSSITAESHSPILDRDYRQVVADLPEFRAMAALSPAYHVVAATPMQNGLRLECRDLRTRAVGTSFGDLIVELDQDHSVQRLELRV